MMLTNVLVYDTEQRAFRKGSMSWENGRITNISREAEGNSDGDCDLIIPGLIDVHTHGRNGYSFTSASVDELKAMKRFYALQGVTTVVPTLSSATLEDWLDAILRIREAGFRAVHLEGRYLNPEKRGAHAAHLLSPLRPEEIDLIAARAGDMHLHVSACYEEDHDGSFMKAVLAHGGTAGLAHTMATYEEAMTAVSRGLRSFSHLFNAMPSIHHRAGGAVVAGLLSDAYVEVICDGFHLAPETVALIGKAKDPSRVVLITDSIKALGRPDGVYPEAGLTYHVKDGRSYTENGTIAGSTLELLNGVKNYAAFRNIPFAGAVSAATANPAAMLELEGVGELKAGYRADFLRLSPDFQLKEVYVGGVKVV